MQLFVMFIYLFCLNVVMVLKRKAKRPNKWFVYEGKTLRAAQPTKKIALKYMKKGRTLKQKK